MKKSLVVAVLLSLSSAAFATTGNVGVDSFYSIGTTDSYSDATNNKYWAHQTLTGASHGSYGTVLRPEGSLPYTRDDQSYEYQETGYPNATYTADSPLTMGTYFTHGTGTTPVLATCSNVSVPFNSSFNPTCIPIFELSGNQSSGYSCSSHCEPLESPLAAQIKTTKGKGKGKHGIKLH